MWAAWELGKRGMTNRKAVGSLLRLAETADDWRTKAMAAGAAWRLDPSSPNPLNMITNHLAQRERGQYEIVPIARGAWARCATDHPNLKTTPLQSWDLMHEYAEDALKQVAPEYLVNPWRE
jgi:hypothetical protein